MTRWTAKWMPRRIPSAAAMKLSQASDHSPTSSTQKKRIDGRSNVAETHVITIAEEHADEHIPP